MHNKNQGCVFTFSVSWQSHDTQKEKILQSFCYQYASLTHVESQISTEETVQAYFYTTNIDTTNINT